MEYKIEIETRWTYNPNTGKTQPSTRWQIRTKGKQIAKLIEEEVERTGRTAYTYRENEENEEYIVEWNTTELPSGEQFLEADKAARSVRENLRKIRQYLEALNEEEKINIKIKAEMPDK